MKARTILWRMLSPNGQVWGFAFLGAMVLIVLLEEEVVPRSSWSFWLLCAGLAFAGLGLLIDTLIGPVKRLLRLSRSDDERT